MTTPLRPAVRELLDALRLRADETARGRPCWIMRTPQYAALVVPAMYGPNDYLRTWTRRTLDDAEHAGLITLGPLKDMPAYNYGGNRWGHGRCHLKGRTITLTTAGGATA